MTSNNFDIPDGLVFVGVLPPVAPFTPPERKRIVTVISTENSQWTCSLTDDDKTNDEPTILILNAKEVFGETSGIPFTLGLYTDGLWVLYPNDGANMVVAVFGLATEQKTTEQNESIMKWIQTRSVLVTPAGKDIGTPTKSDLHGVPQARRPYYEILTSVEPVTDSYKLCLYEQKQDLICIHGNLPPLFARILQYHDKKFNIDLGWIAGQDDDTIKQLLRAGTDDTKQAELKVDERATPKSLLAAVVTLKPGVAAGPQLEAVDASTFFTVYKKPTGAGAIKSPLTADEVKTVSTVFSVFESAGCKVAISEEANHHAKQAFAQHEDMVGSRGPLAYLQPLVCKTSRPDTSFVRMLLKQT